MHSEKSEGKVYDNIYTMENDIDSLKTNSLPDEYSQISASFSDLAVYYAPKCNILWKFRA